MRDRRLGGVVAWWLSRNQQGQVNGQLTAAPGGATRRLNECAAAGRAAAEVGARALPDAPPSRRGWVAVFDCDAWHFPKFTIGLRVGG